MDSQFHNGRGGNYFKNINLILQSKKKKKIFGKKTEPVKKNPPT